MKRSPEAWCFILFLFVVSQGLTSVAFGQTDTPESSQQYKYALGLVQRQLYDESVTVLKRLLADGSPFSKRDGALFWLAESLSRLGKHGEAIAIYDLCLKEFPRGSYADRSAYGLGWAHARDNNPKSAVEAFARVSATDKSLFIDSRLKMGFLMVRFNMDPAKTIAVFDQVLAMPDLPSDKKAEAHLQAGIARFNLNRYEQAAAQFEASLQTATGSVRPGVIFYLAEAYFRDQKFALAEPRFREVITASPTSDLADKASYGLAWCLIKAGKPADAVPILSRLADTTSTTNRFEAWKNLIDLLMNLRRYEEAVKRMAEAARILPGDDGLEMEYMRGLALSRMGEFPKALAAFQAFAKAHPKHKRAEDAHYQCALVQISLGKFREALTTLETLLRRKTEPALREKALYRIGESYFNLGNLKNARDAFERLRREYPEGATRLDALYQLGEIEYAAGNADQALKAFTSLSRTGGEVAAQAGFRCGEVLMKAGRYLDAISAFEAYLTEFPNGPLREDARFKIGLSHLELKDTGKALAAFSELRESQGYFRQEARFQIGEIARGLGNFPLAIQQYKAILAEDPKNPLASRTKRAVGICLFHSKDLPGAEATFKEILKEYPATDIALPESRLWLGKTLLAQGRSEDGVLEILKVPVLYPKSSLVAEAYAEAARAYEKQNLSGRAKKMWKEVLRFQTKGPLAEEARNALK